MNDPIIKITFRVRASKAKKYKKSATKQKLSQNMLFNNFIDTL